jgi:hypothetical protein
VKSISVKQLYKLALVPLALCLSAGLGKAQNAYQGKFSLPFEVRWQNAVLPAGDYTFTMPSARVPYTMFIRGEGKSVIILAVSGNERTVSEKSELTLVKIGDSYVVRSLEAGQIGLDIDYSAGSRRATHTALVRVPVELAVAGK